MKILPAGETYRLTVDTKVLRENQEAHRRYYKTPGAYEKHQKPPCWVQVNEDKQNKINCWHVEWDGPSKFIYGDPHVCGAMMYLETTAELRVWV